MESKVYGKSANDECKDQSFDMEHVYLWITQLINMGSREDALLELGKRREIVPDLAPMIWNSFGAVAALLHEITGAYDCLYPPSLSPTQSNRVCNALALLQCIASHPETRGEFINCDLASYLYPFLSSSSFAPTPKIRPFEYLRLTSLGVIGALVKSDESEVISYLLGTEFIPIGLKIMEYGTELSKTVATFILQKILLDETGLGYICQTYERFSHINMILGKMVLALVSEPSPRLLKHILRCYLRLSDNPRAREALRNCLPMPFRDETFAEILDADKASRQWLITLLKNLERDIE